MTTYAPGGDLSTSQGGCDVHHLQTASLFPPAGKGTKHKTNSALLPGTWKPHKVKGAQTLLWKTVVQPLYLLPEASQQICCPWRNSPSPHILRIITSGLKSDLWFSSTIEELVFFGPLAPFRVAQSAWMTKQMKTVFISKSSGILRALPFCLIFFHFRTLSRT